jgi:hypothetical protein
MKRIRFGFLALALALSCATLLVPTPSSAVSCPTWFNCNNQTDEECFNQCWPACHLNGVCNPSTRHCTCTTQW